MNKLFDSVPEIGKKQPKAHTLGRRAVDLLKSFFPGLWVVREYVPDYGIDLDVELFSENTQMTLGEHVLFQVKGTESLTVEQIQPIQTLPNPKGESGEIASTMEVVKFSLDTKLVATVEKMGSAVVVLLAVVDLTNRRAYIVCLNDYIDKVLLAKNPGYRKQDYVTIHIPTKNCLCDGSGANIVAWYGKRAKLYSFFHLVSVQHHELKYEDNVRKVEVAKKYAERLARLDVWDKNMPWKFFDVKKNELEFFYQNGITRVEKSLLDEEILKGENVDEPIFEATYFMNPASLRDIHAVQGIHGLWDQLNNLSGLFEDCAKHWFLPTDMGCVLSQ